MNFISANLYQVVNMQRDDQDLPRINALASQESELSVDNYANLSRKVGIFQKVSMKWQTYFETLFQFKEIYSDRLKTLRKAFNLKSSKTIEDLGNDEKICELVGLFKRIESKRVRAFQPGYQEKYKPNKILFSEDDTYELQDETSKIKLQIRNSTKINGQGKFNPLQTPYGIIIKCNGDYSAKLNRFILTNVQTPKPAPQRKRILPTGEPKFMGVICEPTIQDLVKIFNIIKTSAKQQNFDICQLAIIGGLDYTSVHQSSQFDELMYNLGSVIDIYIIPSTCQETSHIYPLAPLPQTLLKKSFNYQNCANCSDPQTLESRNQDVSLDVFISCGENLLNLKANCNIKDDLELMKLIIQYRHSCPSSAFSLPIFSYKYDPLILTSTPHLMIHGKCDQFQTTFYQRKWENQSVGVRLVGLSKGEFVRIDLTSNNLQTIRWPLNKIQKMQIQ